MANTFNYRSLDGMRSVMGAVRKALRGGDVKFSVDHYNKGSSRRAQQGEFGYKLHWSSESAYVVREPKLYLRRKGGCIIHEVEAEFGAARVTWVINLTHPDTGHRERHFIGCYSPEFCAAAIKIYEAFGLTPHYKDPRTGDLDLPERKKGFHEGFFGV